jgi:rhodanese-related sulfurtransferase
LTEKLRRGEPVAIVDVRAPEEFAAGHIDGATNIRLDTLPDELARLRSAAAVLTVFSSGGGRSERAARFLRESGLGRVRSLCGGLRERRQRLTQRKGAT